MDHSTHTRFHRRAIYAAIVGGAALAATMTFGASANAQAVRVSRATGHVYVQTDSAVGNAVVAYDRSVDGTLHVAATYATGGLGGILDGSVVDHLASQGSLTYDNGRLYAVNAGSDTITMFRVDGDALTGRQLVSSGGNFPVSVAARGPLVYVLNARDGGSIQGYLRLGDRLILVPSWHRDLGLDPNQKPEFTSTPGQIVFTPDGSKLIVTTKGNGNAIKLFAVSAKAGPSASAVTTQLSGDVPFAVTFDPQHHLVVALAGPNAVATFRINNDRTLTALSTASTGQAATCWIVANGDQFYLSNAGSGTVSAFQGNPHGALTPLGNTATDPGTVDAALSADGRFLYVQTGANGIVDEFRINSAGTPTKTGSVSVPGAVGGEGIVAR